MTGRFPTEGPLLLVESGVQVLDDAGTTMLERVADGEAMSIIGEHLLVGDRRIGTATRQSRERIADQIEHARRTMNFQLDEFAQRTLELLRQEHPFSNRMAEVPEVATTLIDRHVLIVAGGSGHVADLAVLRNSGYLRNLQPARIAVDDGVAAMLSAGERPDITIGDLNELSDKQLKMAGELVHNAAESVEAPVSRLLALGLDNVHVGTGMTSEDVALLLAYEHGAELIVTVGTHTSLNDFLDEGQESMASTFMVRMRVASVLVDAKGVSQLYQDRVRKRDLAMLIASALCVLVVLYFVSEPLRVILRGFLLTFQ